MNNVKIFVSQTFDLNKRDFWLLIAVNIVCGLLLNVFFELHGFIQFLIIGTIGLKHMSFIRGSSIMPSVSSDFDRFSWKYYQGLPLSKTELVMSLVLTNLIVMLPLIVALVCFSPQISVLFEEDFSKIGFGTILKMFFCTIAFFAWTSLISISQQIMNPRRQYSRISPKLQFFELVRNAIVGFAIIIYSITAFVFIISLFDLNLLKLFETPIMVIKYTLQSWLLVPAVFALLVQSYFKLLNNWQNEKIGYLKNNWNTKRDVPMSLASLLSVLIPYYAMDFNVPQRYQDSGLNVAVYNEDYEKIEKLLKSGADINKANENGYGPLFVSVTEGNLKMFKYLLNKGATINEKSLTKNGSNILHLAIISKNGAIFDYVVSLRPNLNVQAIKSGQYPVHLAAQNCRVDMMDILIEKKADLSKVNKDGQTALHVSMKNRCHATTALLLDSGINASVKDKDKKVAMDYLSHSDKNMSYYLAKRTRAPAGQK